MTPSINDTQEKHDAEIVARKLRTPLQASGNPARDKKFTEGGYKKSGYGVAAGAAIDGSFAYEGNQGYFAAGGKEAFLKNVEAMKRFFERHRQKGKEIRLVIKTGIGGQHTPFQGIADGYAVITGNQRRLIGEYELGKDFEAALENQLQELGAGWDQIAVIPSSKSGSTDETMEIFVQILGILLKRALLAQGQAAAKAEDLRDKILGYFRELNISRDKNGADLFKGFSLEALAARLDSGAGEKFGKRALVEVFKAVLGHMFFETTDDPSQSRLSAFIRNSGLDKELGDDAPGFGAMFENVGGRWTADLHMMTFLAYFNLDAEAYWKTRKDQIDQIRNGRHVANQLGNRILDDGITDIALLVPDNLFWFGKSNEQNFNESLWQEGFANLVAIPESLWSAQALHYANGANKLVINLTALCLDEKTYRMTSLPAVTLQGKSPQALSLLFADLFSTFYGMTNTVGNRLIARALRKAGHSPDEANLNDLDNPATQIVQANLFLRQPYVELGKGLVDERFKKLQEEEKKAPGAIVKAMRRSQMLASEGRVLCHIKTGFSCPSSVLKADDLKTLLQQTAQHAEATGRKFVPFLYLEGEKFRQLRHQLLELGVPWVMQGTGDQHISYQQVLAQPQKYLPLMVSFLPEEGRELPGLPAIGFAKAHLDRISPHLLRDYFAEASYEALTQLRAAEGADAEGVFIRLVDSAAQRELFKKAASDAIDPALT